MEFHVQLRSRSTPLAAIEAQLLQVDPAAVIDIDPLNPLLRIATLIESPALVNLLNKAGLDVSAADIRQLPSTCCGGCSG
ncbi:MAG: hypothetical protein R3F22_04015 [Lysobacteraceae bacterium]